MAARSLTPETLFMKVYTIPFCGCWIWSGYTRSLSRSYARAEMTYKGKKQAAGRASWLIHNGDIPPGKQVLHNCNIASCVNPAHLYLGDVRDNTRDRVAAGYPGPFTGYKHTEDTISKMRNSHRLRNARRV